ncbi:glycosyltransferase family 2 protein [Thiobacillus sedimenti]|uniref:Glycosyltransferase n=1 Tax=Thiobacillus sedimenti TaxID=3110231 RepID=A0ABZ1CL89_9PROT|nr:glycosyltransferase [Thiobacillus sp. SCUT-2]WRS39641.1 glycosyltransferase [Thiobacillus sp. SCUT-2]
MSPRISVVIPCYNGAAFLHEAIDSALSQIGVDHEVIVVNDGSTDDSRAIMARYGPRIRVVDQANAGLPAARNAGIRAAQGALFAFLDADDWWAPDFLAKLSAALDAHPQAAIAYCGWKNAGLPGGRGEPFIPPDYEAMPDKTAKLLCSPRWPVHAAMIRREHLFDAGLFDPALKRCEDFALWLRSAIPHPLVRVPEVLAYYRHHGNQMIADQARIALAHFDVQQAYLTAHPEIASRFSRRALRALTDGELLLRGYACYWQRDLPAARRIFRAVMKHGYGRLADWKYMLPAWLPESWHRRLLGLRESIPRAFDGPI